MTSGTTDSPPAERATELPPVHEAWLPREHSLYRPRHGRQLLALACAAVFFGFPLLSSLLGVRPPEIENRAAQDFPGITEGWGFLTGLAGWATDNLPYRHLAIGADDAVSRGVFGEMPDFGGRGDTVGPIAPPSQGRPSINENDRAPDGFPRVIEGADGWLYYGLDASAKCVPNQSLDEVTGTVTRLREAVESSGRRFVLMVVPDKTTMVPEHLPAEYPGKSCAAPVRDEFWRRAVDDLGVLDLRPAIRSELARTNGDVYFKQDSHWNFTGGLMMTRVLAEHLRPDVSRSWKTTLGPEWTSDADLPKMIAKRGENRAMQFGLAPDGTRDRTDRDDSDFNQTLRFRGDPVRGSVETKTAMLADSFTQFACPYLSATFTDISITHLERLRKYPDEVVRTITDSDTVVIEVVERHLSAGLSVVSDPKTVDKIAASMAANPRR